MDRMHDQRTPQPAIASFLLDRTGSMASIKDETIGGFNAYLDTLERVAAGTRRAAAAAHKRA
jgi:hypothetical protein